MALDFNKRKKGESKREYAARMQGGKPSDYNSDGSSKSSSKSSSSSKKEFEKLLKNAGVYDAYAKLPDDQKEFALYNYDTNKSGSKEKINALANSLKEATKDADVYWGSYLKVAQDEILRSVDDTKNTYQYQKNELEIKIQEISKELASNRDFYTLEQQADLAKLKQSYEQQRGTVIEEASNAGLTFSTNKEKKMTQLNDYNENVVTSTNRQYEKKLSDLQVGADTSIAENQRKLGLLDTGYKSDITALGRTAENELGTSNVPTIEGYNALGDVAGNLYEDRVKDVEDRKNAIFNEKIAASLNF